MVDSSSSQGPYSIGSPSTESEVPIRFFGDDPPVDVRLRMPAFDVVFEFVARFEVLATEVTAMMAFRHHVARFVFQRNGFSDDFPPETGASHRNEDTDGDRTSRASVAENGGIDELRDHRSSGRREVPNDR